MNYVALAGTIPLALFALTSLAFTIQYVLGTRSLTAGGYLLNVATVTCFGTAAVALGSLVVS